MFRPLVAETGKEEAGENKIFAVFFVPFLATPSRMGLKINLSV